MFELRSAPFSEYAAIAKLHAESWRKSYRGIMSDHFLDGEAEKELIKMWQIRLASPSPNQLVTVAVQKEIIVGFSCIYLDDSATLGTLLDNLHVSGDAQKSGVGSALIKNCAKLIFEKGSICKMYLWVFDANQNAKQFYARLGGNNMETIKKQNVDGTEANICKYYWDTILFLIK